MQQHSYGSTVWGSPSHVSQRYCLFQAMGRLCAGNMSSLPQWHHLHAPVLWSFLPHSGFWVCPCRCCPPQPVFPQWTENWAEQHTNVVEGEPEASHGFTQYSLNCWVSGTARGSQYQSRCHCGHEGGNVQFTASVKLIFSYWSFLVYPKGVKSTRIKCTCLTNIL